MSDLEDLMNALNNQPGVKELEDAMNQQQRLTTGVLEALGIKPQPEKPKLIAMIEFGNKNEAQTARQQLGAIAGVQAGGKDSQVIVSLDVPINEGAKGSVETISVANKWPLSDWYNTLHKV